MNKILIPVFMVLVIASECAVAFFLIPSQAQIEQIAASKVEEKIKEHSDHDDPAGHHGHEDTIEIELGKFSVTAFQPASNTTLRIDFQLHGTIAAAEKEHFGHVYDSNTFRIREQVIVITRNSEVSDLTDPGLGLIKRKILEKTNRLLGKAYLQNIVVSDFSFVEQ